MSQTHLRAFYALLGMAEKFRSANPPNYKLCVHFLEACLTLNLPPHYEALVRRSLAKILFFHSKSYQMVLVNLNKAWQYYSNNEPEDALFETAYLLGDFFQKQGHISSSLEILRQAMKLSENFPVWHIRILFRLGEYCLQEGDLGSAAYYMCLGAEFCVQLGAHFPRILFILCKGLVHLLQRNFCELNSTMSPCADLRDSFSGTGYQHESLKSFYFFLQVCHLLQLGQLKKARPFLKSLQRCVQILSQKQDTEIFASDNLFDQFLWLTRDQLSLLTYAVTISYSLLTGKYNKVSNYLHKAMDLLERIRNDNPPKIMAAINLFLIESVIQFRLICGQKHLAILSINEACLICQQFPNMGSNHFPQLHCYLGFYALSLSMFDEAEQQFTTSIALSRDSDFCLYTKFCLALLYLRSGRQTNLIPLLQQINMDISPNACLVQQTCSQLLLAYQNYLNARYPKTTELLEKAIVTSSSEDLTKLTIHAFALLSQVEARVGNANVALMQLNRALGLCDPNCPTVQYLRLLKNLRDLTPDVTAKARVNATFVPMSTIMMNDSVEAINSPEHKLIYWLDGRCPVTSPTICSSSST